MWGRKRKDADAEKPSEPPQRLKDALRKARVDQAERSGVVVDLHDAEVALRQALHEALDPIPHGGMGRDKRVYRLLQETRYGRKVLAESVNVPEIVHAVTKYLAQRVIEREVARGGAL